MTFSINEIKVENLNYFKFLGIKLNEHLTWKANTNMITIKLSKVVGILNKLKYVYPKSALMNLYTSLFLSHINYGLLLWGTAIERAFLLQKRVIRMITGSEYRAHSKPLFKMSDLLTDSDLFNLKLLKFYYKVSYQFLPRYFDGYLDVPYDYTLRRTARPLIRLPRSPACVCKHLASMLHKYIYKTIILSAACRIALYVIYIIKMIGEILFHFHV